MDLLRDSVPVSPFTGWDVWQLVRECHQTWAEIMERQASFSVPMGMGDHEYGLGQLSSFVATDCVLNRHYGVARGLELHWGMARKVLVGGLKELHH